MHKYQKEYHEIKEWFKRISKYKIGKQLILMIIMMLYALIVRILVIVYVPETGNNKELSLFLFISHIFLFLVICKICFGKWWDVEDDEK